jgi:hypothetical protein
MPTARQAQWGNHTATGPEYLCSTVLRGHCPHMPPTECGSGGNALPSGPVVPACRTSQEHQLPLSTCHVRSGPWTTWRVTGPDRTVTPRPWRPATRQPRAGTPATPPCRANQAAAATGAGWPSRSDTRDNANADPLGTRSSREPQSPGLLRTERCLIRTPTRRGGRPRCSHRMRPVQRHACLTHGRGGRLPYPDRQIRRFITHDEAAPGGGRHGPAEPGPAAADHIRRRQGGRQAAGPAHWKSPQESGDSGRHLSTSQFR